VQGRNSSPQRAGFGSAVLVNATINMDFSHCMASGSNFATIALGKPGWLSAIASGIGCIVGSELRQHSEQI
jgi:hypothetical protein